MEKFTKPELLNFLCEDLIGNPDDKLTSFDTVEGGANGGKM